MKPEHDEIIRGAAHSAELGICHAHEFLRAAAERGYRLARIPEPMNDLRWHTERRIGYNLCLTDIEAIETEDGDG